MKLADVTEGLQILLKYAGNDQYCIAAEHDEIWAGNDEWSLSAEDKARMEELGWSCLEEGMGWHAWI